MKKNSGFTLVELMVTIAIVSLLATGVAINYTTWVDNFRLSGSARDVYSALQAAKLSAIKGSYWLWLILMPGLVHIRRFLTLAILLLMRLTLGR